MELKLNIRLALKHRETGEIAKLFEPSVFRRGRGIGIVFTNNFYDFWHGKAKIEVLFEEYEIIAYE